MRDADPLSRGHLISLLFDLYLAHGQLLFGFGGYKAKRRVEQSTDQSDGMFGQERKNKTCDLVVLLIQGEMAGVEQVDFGVRKIAPEGLPTGSDKRGIVSPPNHQSRRLVLAQPRLPRQGD